MNQQAIPSLDQIEVERQARSTILNLASALTTTFRIQEGRELPVVLGFPHESSNRGALLAWIRAWLKKPGAPSAHLAFAYLANAFAAKLRSLEDREW